MQTVACASFCRLFSLLMMNSFVPELRIYFACESRKEKHMDERKKNLCAMIPESLHSRVRAEQEQLALTLSEYVEKIIREHFEGGTKAMANGTGTLALQISEELFFRLKEHLSKHGMTQKEFIIGLIETALTDAADAKQAQ